MQPEIRAVASLPKLSFSVSLYCFLGVKVVRVRGNAQVDSSKVLNQVTGEIKMSLELVV